MMMLLVIHLQIQLLCLSRSCAFCEGFTSHYRYHSLNQIRYNSGHLQRYRFLKFQASLTTATETSLLADDDDDDDNNHDGKYSQQAPSRKKRRNQKYYRHKPIIHAKSGRRILRHNNNNEKQSFRRFLQQLKRTIRNRKTLANRMDDELKAMECSYYNVSSHDDTSNLLNLRYPYSLQYRGHIIPPDVSCYAMVANAYANAGLGNVGAQLAEDVVQRCQHFATTFKDQPNTILKTACMNAWVHADNWERANHWLRNMESTYESTGHSKDAPDTITYTQYLEGVAASKVLPVDAIHDCCEYILKQMKTQAEAGVNSHVSPNRYTYISAMKCLARRRPIHEQPNDSQDQRNNSSLEGGMAIVHRVEALLRELEVLHQETGASDLQPNAYCYVPIANAAAQCQGGLEAARYTERLLKEALQKFSFDGCSAKPLDGLYTACFTAYARVEPEDAPEASKRVVHLMQQLKAFHQTQSKGTSPSVHAYTAAINGLVVHDTTHNLQQAESLLQSMPVVDSVAYQCVIKAFARNDNPARAEQLLWELYNHSATPANRQHDNRVMPPDVITIAACINAWVKGRTSHDDLSLIHRSLEQANKLLEFIVESYKRQTRIWKNQRHVDIWVFENVVRLYSISRRKDAGEQAERWIHILKDLAETVSAERFQPTLTLFTYALDAWASSGHDDAPKRTLLLFQEMQRLAEDGAISRINARALSSTLSVISKAKGEHYIQQTEDIFQRLVDLRLTGDKTCAFDARKCTSVLSSLARSQRRDACDKSLAVLHQIRNLGKQGHTDFTVNTIAYNCVLNLLAGRGMPEEAETLLAEMLQFAVLGDDCAPDAVSYSCLCRAYSRTNSGGVESTERCLAILSEVEERFEKNNVTHMRPDTWFYNAVLAALARAARSDETAAEKAHDLLMRMELSVASDKNPTPPDIVSFCSVCKAFATSSAPGSSEKAEDVLQRVEDMASTGALPFPDGVFYSSLALAFIRSQKPNIEKAFELVDRMEVLVSEGRQNISPSMQTYNNLLGALAHTRVSDNLSKAKEIFGKMKEKASSLSSTASLRKAKDGPGVFSYNWMILTAANSRNDSPSEAKDAFQTALDAFRELHSDDCIDQPNSHTYAYFMKACHSLLPAGEERDKVMAKAFNLCRDSGLVSKEIFTDAINLIPDILSVELQRAEISYKLHSRNDARGDAESQRIALPEKWTHNLPAFRRDAFFV